MIAIEDVFTSADSAKVIAERAQASLPGAFVSIPTATEPLEVEFTGFVGKTVVGKTRQGLDVVITLGEDETRDSRFATIILSRKTD